MGGGGDERHKGKEIEKGHRNNDRVIVIESAGGGGGDNF